jgi:hypothetical protein
MVGVDMPAGWEVNHELIRASLLFLLGGQTLVALVALAVPCCSV